MKFSEKKKPIVNLLKNSENGERKQTESALFKIFYVHSTKYFASLARILNLNVTKYIDFFFVSVKKLSVVH